MDTRELGKLIRSVRLGKNLTLQQVAERTGYSTSHLSHIEIGKANPSISTLHAIAQALGETVASFFRPKPDFASANGPTLSGSAYDQFQSEPLQLSKAVAVVRQNMRKGLVMPGNGLKQELLTPDLKRRIEVLWTAIPPGTKSGVYNHDGEEFGIILNGELFIRVADEEFILNEGDSIYFESSNPHSFENLTNKTVETIWVITPPSF